MISQAILDNLITTVLVIDQRLTVHYSNPAAEQLLKLSAKRLRGEELHNLYHHLSSSQQLFHQALAANQGFTDNLATLITQDLRQLTIDLCVTPIHWQQQSMLLLELRQVDQQQRINAEQQQFTQQQLAKELLKGLAHEIKNPLGGLRGAAQLLHRQLPDAGQQEFTQMIIEQADRLSNLVDRLLGPQQPQQYSSHNIHQVLEKTTQLVSIDLPPGIRLTRDYDPSIPDLEMDPEQIQQALLNIIQNAVQALVDHGEIRILTRIANQITLNGARYRMAAEIKIIDTGPGIPSALQQTLFYPMVTGRANGTGLGLSIAQTLIQQHQGRIDCVSQPGHTEFTIHLPLNQQQHRGRD